MLMIYPSRRSGT